MPKLLLLAVVVLLLGIPGFVVVSAQDEEAKKAADDEAAQEVAVERAEARPGDPAVAAMLDRALPQVTFDSVGLSDVLDFLRDLTDATIVVNWRALERAGIDRDGRVNLQLRHVKFSKALQLILDDVGGDEIPLKYTVAEGVITISTVNPAHARTYDVRDILKGSAAAAPRLDAAKRLATLTQMITGSVAPGSWRDDHVTANPDEGTLVIMQTPDNHAAVANLLAQTRALLGLPRPGQPPREEPLPDIVPIGKK